MKHLLTVKTSKAETITRVLIGDQLLFGGALEESLLGHKKRIALITDSIVERVIARTLLEHLQKRGIEVALVSFPAGEQYKSRETKQMIEDQLLAHRMGRDALILAVGGGVVCDMAGFVAATYARGIPVIFVPTTLLAMVDASIGGKTAVNTPHGKNLIGAFYPPIEVYIDFSLLTALPETEKLTGCAEIIKTGLVGSRELFSLMSEECAQWKGCDLDFWMRVLKLACITKRDIVEGDPRESGRRRILNFGHTIGHAIELLEEYEISHGEAVAMGMVVESFLSVKMGLLSFEKWDEVIEGIKKYPFTFALSAPLEYNTLIDVISTDKKALAQKARFVLLQSIGMAAPFQGAYCTPVEPAMLQESLAVMNELCLFV